MTCLDREELPLLGSSYAILRCAHWALGSLIKAAMSDAPPNVSGYPWTHMLCSAVDPTEKSLCLNERDAIYIQSHSFLLWHGESLMAMTFSWAGLWRASSPVLCRKRLGRLPLRKSRGVDWVRWCSSTVGVQAVQRLNSPCRPVPVASWYFKRNVHAL